jgi:hypothetical protein
LSTNTTTWARLLAYVTGLVNQELLLQNEYLAAENRILKARLQPGWRLSDGERSTLAEIGRRLAQVRHGRGEKLAKCLRISSGGSRVYTTFSIAFELIRKAQFGVAEAMILLGRGFRDAA